MKQCSKFLLSLVSCLFLLLLCTFGVQAKKQRPTQIYLSDSTFHTYVLGAELQKKDTISLIGKGRRSKGSIYYKTSKKNIIVVTKPENKSGVWLGFLSKLITTIFHAKV